MSKAYPSNLTLAQYEPLPQELAGKSAQQARASALALLEQVGMGDRKGPILTSGLGLSSDSPVMADWESSLIS